MKQASTLIGLLALCIFSEPALAGKKRSASATIKDQVVTAAIDAAKEVAVTRLSRVPDTGQIEIAFAPYPQRSAENLVIKAINAAQVSVFMAAYQMTSKPIADAMCAAAKRGAAVSAVLDKKSNPHDTTGYSKRDYMAACGVDIRVNSNYPIMHDKFIVVDGKHVESGSFNYTFAAAERNAENAIVVWNNPYMAEKYAKEFDRLFNEAVE